MRGSVLSGLALFVPCKVAQSCLTLCDPHRLYPTRLLCPWGCPDKDTGVGGHALFQGIFLIQGLNPSLLHLLHWFTSSATWEACGLFSHTDVNCETPPAPPSDAGFLEVLAEPQGERRSLQCAVKAPRLTRAPEERRGLAEAVGYPVGGDTSGAAHFRTSGERRQKKQPRSKALVNVSCLLTFLFGTKRLSKMTGARF